MKTSIRVENVWRVFHLSHEKEARFKEYAINMIRGKLRFEKFWALKDISFELSKGESLGIVGLNGAGKSTLLKIVSGIMEPTVGTVETRGVIAPLIEVGSGLDGDMNAVENIFFTGTMHGLSRKYLSERKDAIIEYAELGEFADMPLRNYSSGMKARLGFSIATEIQPEILIVDEVLSVGDYPFREKSMRRMKTIIDSGVTLLFVSHAADQVKKLCKKALWLDQGYMRMFGDSASVCDAYTQYCQVEA